VEEGTFHGNGRAGLHLIMTRGTIRDRNSDLRQFASTPMKTRCRNLFCGAILRGFLSGDIGASDPGQMLGSEWKCIIATVSDGNAEIDVAVARIRDHPARSASWWSAICLASCRPFRFAELQKMTTLRENLWTNSRHDCARASLIDRAFAPQPPAISGVSRGSIMSVRASYDGEELCYSGSWAIRNCPEVIGPLEWRYLVWSREHFFADELSPSVSWERVSVASRERVVRAAELQPRHTRHPSFHRSPPSPSLCPTSPALSRPPPPPAICCLPWAGIASVSSDP
jgi:hypothetical protein